MIVIGGEALVDLVPDPSTADGELGPLHPRLGGGPYNVAIALGRLGVPAAFFARLSTDQFGDKLLERLRSSNVDVELVQRGPEPTSLAVVGLAENGSARYSFHTEGTAARFVTDQQLPEQATAVCLGTLGLVLEPGASVYEKVLFREAEQGRFIALDPNIRADLITDPVAYRARFASWLPSVGLLKVSDDDAEWLAGDQDVLNAARDWQRRGPAAVVLTRGADGLTVVTGDGEPVSVPGCAPRWPTPSAQATPCRQPSWHGCTTTARSRPAPFARSTAHSGRARCGSLRPRLRSPCPGPAPNRPGRTSCLDASRGYVRETTL